MEFYQPQIWSICMVITGLFILINSMHWFLEDLGFPDILSFLFYYHLAKTIIMKKTGNWMDPAWQILNIVGIIRPQFLRLGCRQTLRRLLLFILIPLPLGTIEHRHAITIHPHFILNLHQLIPLLPIPVPVPIRIMEATIKSIYLVVGAPSVFHALSQLLS